MNVFRINKPHVSAEVFEDEVVVVNLLNGNYYSIMRSGFDIWRLIEAGYDKAEILNRFDSSFEITEEVETFLNDLLNLELIVPIESEEQNHEKRNIQISEDYSKPTLEQYTDMQDLLMLDPIHEVDETGWPKPAAGEKPEENE